MIRALILAFYIVSASQKLKVHLVPHSHLELGLLRTDEDYFWGCGFSKNEVNIIISELVSSLSVSPERRGILAEVAYIKRWWEIQTPNMRATFSRLLKSGQLEIVNGGWSMADEACTSHYDLLDNFVLAHQFLYNTFDYVPKIGFQTDAYGHSAYMGELMANMNYTALVLSRVHFDLKELLHRDKNLELLWKPRDTSKGLFVHILVDGYAPPFFINFEGTFGRCENFITDTKSCFNADLVIHKLEEWINFYSSGYKTKNIMILIGDAFSLASERTFINLDSLIEYNNRKPDSVLELKYSTVSEYFAEFQKPDSYLKFGGDFFPYAETPHAYWSGFYTSRFKLKYRLRKASQILRATERIIAHEYIRTLKFRDFTEKTKEFREFLAIMQHHNGISGTAAPYTVEKNLEKLDMMEIDNLDIWESIFDSAVYRCRVDKTVCDNLKNEDFSVSPVTLIVINTQYYHVHDVLHILVKSPKLEVTNCQNALVEHHVIENMNKEYIVLIEINIESMYSTCFHIRYNKNRKPIQYAYNTVGYLSNSDYIIKFKNSQISFLAPLTLNISLQYEYYRGNSGDEIDSQTTGIFVFRPEGQSKKLCNFSNFRLIKTSLLDSLYMSCGRDVHTFLNLRKIGNNLHPEFVHSVNGITDNAGKEIIVKYSTNWKHTGQFVTDSNMYFTIQRKTNNLGGMSYRHAEPVAGNYYPVSGYIGIEKKKKGFLSIVTDRTQGGTVLDNDGSSDIELMLLRKCMYDDGIGIGLGLHEKELNGVYSNIRTTHRMVISDNLESVNAVLTMKENPVQTFYSLDNDGEFELDFMPGSLDLDQFDLHIRVKQIGVLSLTVRCLATADFPIQDYSKKLLGDRDFLIYESNIQQTQIFNLVREELICCEEFGMKAFEIRLL